MTIERDPGEPHIVVPVPLAEYLNLLSAREALNRPTRTHAQAAIERVVRVTGMVASRLLVLSQPEVRGKRRTATSCSHLESEIERSLLQFSRYYHHPEIHPLFDVFYPCRAHYMYFYDENGRRIIEKYQQKLQNIYRSRKYSDLTIGIHERYPNPKTGKPPVLAEYMNQLPSELQPALPLYVACHFISNPHLPIPPEIEQTVLGNT